MRHLHPRLSQLGALGTYVEVGKWEGGREQINDPRETFQA